MNDKLKNLFKSKWVELYSGKDENLYSETLSVLGEKNIRYRAGVYDARTRLFALRPTIPSEGPTVMPDRLIARELSTHKLDVYYIFCLRDDVSEARNAITTANHILHY